MLLTSNRLNGTLKMFTNPDLGEVYQAIATPTGKGRIKFQGSLWPAQIWNVSDEQASSVPLLPRDLVWVIGRVGLTLLVQPYHPARTDENTVNFSGANSATTHVSAH